MAVMPPMKPVSPTLRGGCRKEVPDVWPGLYKLLGVPGRLEGSPERGTHREHGVCVT